MIALQEPQLVQRVEQFARSANQDEAAVVATAVQVYLDQAERAKIHAETVAFWDMYPTLQRNYSGEYVAIHHGEVVDHDEDVLQLERRVVKRLGDIALLIAPVTAAPQPKLQVTSFRLEV